MSLKTPIFQNKPDKLKMMIASILITTFCLLSGIQAEVGVCRGKGWGQGHNDGDYRK